ncbi:MAG: hypothetical protein L6R39_006440, partial [Caloplaca ligustica]
MSPTPSSTVSPLFSFSPYPSPTSVTPGPLGHSSPAAIIIAWVLTAFLPIPLIVLIVLLRYFPDSLTELLSRYGLPFQQLAKRPPGFSRVNSIPPSSPSSRILTVSNRNSQTLTVPSYGFSTPTQDGHRNQGSFSPRTPQNSVAISYESPGTPTKSKTPSKSTGSPYEAGKNASNALNFLPSCFESPKRLAFLEPPSIHSTPRKKSYARLSTSSSLSSLRKPSIVNPPATPHVLWSRRLKHRLTTSVISFGLVFAMYVLEGLSIAAAQSFAYVRILSQSGGNGGLGEGKEDERWLIPWVIYIVLQGSLVMGCAWVVWEMRQELKQADRKWRSEKGKGVQRPKDVLSNPSKNHDKVERFLPDYGHEPTANVGQLGTEEEQVDEPEWRTLGYHPTFAAIQSPTSSSTTASPNPRSTLSELHRQISHSLNSNGEGSSRCPPSPPTAGSSTPFHASPLPVAFLREKARPWWAERSRAEIELQQKNTSSRWRSENDEPRKEDRMALLREELLGVPSKRSDSWTQEVEVEVGEETVPTPGKGKGKAEAEGTMESIELTPQLPREFVTGIDLGKAYRFSDGLAYPLLPLPSRKTEKPVPRLDAYPDDSDSFRPPFSLPLPPRLPAPTSPAPTRFSVPSPRSSTFTFSAPALPSSGFSFS